MHTTRTSFGAAVVTVVCDAVGPFFEPLDAAFPGATPEVLAEARRLEPAVFGADGEWVLHFHCFLLDVAGRTVLVDAGVGGTDAPAAGWAPVPGRLLAALDEVGCAPGDVDLVVLTHLHGDHVGGSVTGGRPAFPGARYVTQAADVASVAGTPVGRDVVAPLRDADALQVVDGDTRLLPGLDVVATPGHTPGHQSVLAGDRLVVTGDVLVHPVQLVDPDVAYHYEADPDLARRTRTRLLAAARDRGATLAVSHLASGLVDPPPWDQPTRPVM